MNVVKFHCHVGKECSSRSTPGSRSDKARLQTETVRLRWLRQQNVLCCPKEWLAGNHDLVGVPRTFAAPSYPGTSWASVKPEDHNWSSAKLNEAWRYAQGHRFGGRVGR
jgi:hypothetical protein